VILETEWRSTGSIGRKLKRYLIERGKKHLTYNKKARGLSGMAISYIGTALIKHVI